METILLRLPSISNSTAVTDNEWWIYIIGGENGNIGQNTVYAFDTKNNEIHDFSKMKDKRISPLAYISKNQRLWVIGG